MQLNPAMLVENGTDALPRGSDHVMRDSRQAGPAAHADEGLSSPGSASATLTAEAYVAQAMTCLKEAEDNPDRQHYWMAEAVLRLQQSSDVWRRQRHTNNEPCDLSRVAVQYLRAGNWVLVSKLPMPAGQRTLNRIAENGWIERRGGGPRSEIKLTPSGLMALQTPI